MRPGGQKILCQKWRGGGGGEPLPRSKVAKLKKRRGEKKEREKRETTKRIRSASRPQTSARPRVAPSRPLWLVAISPMKAQSTWICCSPNFPKLSSRTYSKKASPPSRPETNWTLHPSVSTALFPGPGPVWSENKGKQEESERLICSCQTYLQERTKENIQEQKNRNKQKACAGQFDAGMTTPGVAIKLPDLLKTVWPSGRVHLTLP